MVDFDASASDRQKGSWGIKVPNHPTTTVEVDDQGAVSLAVVHSCTQLLDGTGNQQVAHLELGGQPVHLAKLFC